MSAVICLLAVLSAPPANTITPEAKQALIDGLEDQTPLAPHEIRQSLRATLRDEALSETTDKRHRAIMRLCALYAEMMLNEDFAQMERDKWRAKLGSRLRSVRDDLVKNLPAETSSSESTASSEDGAKGGGAVDARGARQLIDLITTTIDPETWEANGGQGSIFYFNNLRVLVVRQTQDVHEKLGGLLPGLR